MDQDLFRRTRNVRKRTPRRPKRSGKEDEEEMTILPTKKTLPVDARGTRHQMNLRRVKELAMLESQKINRELERDVEQATKNPQKEEESKKEEEEYEASLTQKEEEMEEWKNEEMKKIQEYQDEQERKTKELLERIQMYTMAKEKREQKERQRQEEIKKQEEIKRQEEEIRKKQEADAKLREQLLILQQKQQEEQKREEARLAAAKEGSQPQPQSQPQSQPQTQPQIQPQIQPQPVDIPKPVQEQPKPKPEVKKPSTPKPVNPNKHSAEDKYLELLQKKRDIEQQILGWKNQNRAESNTWYAKINRPVSQISSERAQVIKKTQELTQVLRDAKAASPLHYLFCVNLFAEKVVRKGDNEVERRIADKPPFIIAMPIAAVVAAVSTNGFPEVIDCLQYQFAFECPYVVPFYPKESPKRASEGEDRFLERMSGFIALYIAICTVGVEEVKVAGGTPPSSKSLNFGSAWSWFAKILNMEPKRVTGTILWAALETGVLGMMKVYGAQMIKIVKFVKNDYMARLQSMKAEEKTPGEIAKIQVWLQLNEKTIKDKREWMVNEVTLSGAEDIDAFISRDSGGRY
eukprot:TRINITY_DN4916_c0_g1_i1.p1 TRINITY_DN4916_c0_g1~~TRINITY_DN4916_c0_g1_i1.p1  ORF type:complete len:576 (-),score=196.02 TRINITY_DN4916_c0_g1_i1:27-1754(-)